MFYHDDEAGTVEMMNLEKAVGTQQVTVPLRSCGTRVTFIDGPTYDVDGSDVTRAGIDPCDTRCGIGSPAAMVVNRILGLRNEIPLVIVEDRSATKRCVDSLAELAQNPGSEAHL